MGYYTEMEVVWSILSIQNYWSTMSFLLFINQTEPEATEKNRVCVCVCVLSNLVKANSHPPERSLLAGEAGQDKGRTKTIMCFLWGILKPADCICLNCCTCNVMGGVTHSEERAKRLLLYSWAHRCRWLANVYWQGRESMPALPPWQHRPILLGTDGYGIISILTSDLRWLSKCFSVTPLGSQDTAF